MIWWIAIALQTLLFAAWIWLAFRTLFDLSARIRHQTGQMLPGPRGTLQGFALFFRAPEYAPRRRQLGLLTLALFAAIGLTRLLGGPYG